MKKVFFFLFAVFFPLLAFSAEAAAKDAQDARAREDAQKRTYEKLPFGYGAIKLGMSVDEVKSALLKQHEFGYRGDRDVSLSPGTEQVLIETDARYAGFSYLDRCWFQFLDGKLYIITINLDREKVDHYSVFSSLCAKYGGPNQISPQKSAWQDEDVMMSLERPLTLKYIDAKAFNERLDHANVDKTIGEQNRQRFLEGL